MLTVWRRLHVECDTMAAFDGESDHMDVVQGTIQNPDPEPVAVVQWGWNDHVTVVDRFVPGAIWDDQSKFGWVQANTAGDLFEVTHNSDDGFTQQDEAQLYDDDFDLENCDEWDPLPRANILPQTPDLSDAQIIYRKAYIEVDDEGGDWNSTIPFAPYRPGNHVIQHTQRGNHNLGRDWYWIGYALNAFQHEEDDSGDPNYLCVQGYSPPRDGTWGGSCVYVEPLRDRDAQMGISTRPGMVVAHELAHSIPSVEGGHPVLFQERQVLEKISSTQFKMNGTLPVAGWNIVSGSRIRIQVPGVPYEDSTTAEGWLSGWQNVANGCIITLQGNLRYEPYGPRKPNQRVQWDYQVGDYVEIWSKSAMGKFEAGTVDFCAAWLAKLRNNVHTPLEWLPPPPPP